MTSQLLLLFSGKETRIRCSRFTITPKDEARVYGIPLGGAVIDVKNIEWKILNSFMDGVGINGNRSHNVKIMKLWDLAIPTKGPRPPVAMVVKQFLLLATGSLLMPTFAQMCHLDFAPYT
ncbi:unnamed protein product [Linum trigynum]|uniref:Uncharacterized protein n=1 Tax=Linum trigynum TaxID=586398 RepID=A0AAV2FVA7_9ROSI